MLIYLFKLAVKPDIIVEVLFAAHSELGLDFEFLDLGFEFPIFRLEGLDVGVVVLGLLDEELLRGLLFCPAAADFTFENLVARGEAFGLSLDLL